MSNFLPQRFDNALPQGDVRRCLRRLAAQGLRCLRSALPQACVLCGAPSGDALICDNCSISFEKASPACPSCATPAPSMRRCGGCLARPPPFDVTIAAWAYAFPLDRLLHALKYGGSLSLAEPLGQAVACAAATRGDSSVDALVPLPLSPARQRERGFNQAHEIAKHVGARLGIPLIRGLARIRDSPPQATLAWDTRVRNVRDAFAADVSVRGRHIAIVDDVMTTGATLAAAAKALRRAGALRVEAWVVARTPPPDRA